jgi:hypothetical protein
MADVVEIVVLASGGQNCLTLLEDGAPVNITTLTNAKLDLGDDETGANVTIDSDTEPTVFDWGTFGANGTLILTLGASLNTHLAGKPGRYYASLMVSDGVKYNDLVWVNRNDRSSPRLVIQASPAFGA